MHDVPYPRTCWFLGSLQLLSLLLKLSNLVPWSWWIVLSPALLVTGIVVGATMAVFAYCCVREVVITYHIFKSKQEFFRD